MARIIGSQLADELVVSVFDGSSVVRGRAGDDDITGNEGSDKLWGDLGNDQIRDFSAGFNQLFGGRGNDTVELGGTGQAWGGVGNDQIFVSPQAGPLNMGVGGSGNDYLQGFGDLYGDEGPGRANHAVGNDTIETLLFGADYTRMTGGLGADVFTVRTETNGDRSAAEIMDFTAGQDKVGVHVWNGDTPSGHDALGHDAFNDLDANHNGTLEWSDSLSGGSVFADGRGTMWLGLGAPEGVPTGADDWLVVHGTNQITAADWLTV